MDALSNQTAEANKLLTEESLFNAFLEWYSDTLSKGDIKEMNSHNITWIVSVFIAMESVFLLSNYNFMKIEASLVKNCRKLI